MKLSPFLSIPLVLTLGVILAGCSSPTVPNNTATPSSSQTGKPSPTANPSPSETPLPVSTLAPVKEVKDAGFEVGVDAQKLVTAEWPKDITVPDVSTVTAAKKYGDSSVGLLVTSTGGDVEAIQPYLASLEDKGMSFIDDYKADGIVVYYYENADYVLEVIVTPVGQPDSGGYAGTTRFKVTPTNLIQ